MLVPPLEYPPPADHSKGLPRAIERAKSKWMKTSSRGADQKSPDSIAFASGLNPAHSCA